MISMSMRKLGARGIVGGGLILAALGGAAFAQAPGGEKTATPPPARAHKSCIAHRGASAYYPEHTIISYRKAIEMGADFVEPDLVLSKEGTLICMHDETLERTTNVAEIFPDRYDRIDPTGQKKKHWRVVDFTVPELKRLDAGRWKDPSFAGEQIVTFQELIDLVKIEGKGRVGIYPELKSPAYHAKLGMKQTDEFLRVLKANGLDTKEALEKLPVIVQCFEPPALRDLKKITGDLYPLIQLVDVSQAKLLMSDLGMRDTAKYANGLGPAIQILIADKSRVQLAHELGLVLHPYTVDWKQVPSVHGDAKGYMDYLLYDLGVDGLFTNNPDMFPR